MKDRLPRDPSMTLRSRSRTTKCVSSITARKTKPFVTVNSGSLPPDLLENNLFGHVKGAFTGAVSPKKGLFEIADGGSN